MEKDGATYSQDNRIDKRDLYIQPFGVGTIEQIIDSIINVCPELE